MLWRIIRWLCASRSYSERSAADAAAYGLSGLKLSVVITCFSIAPLKLAGSFAVAINTARRRGLAANWRGAGLIESAGFGPVVVESLCLRCRPEWRRAFAQIFGGGWRGRLELLLPLLIPHPHPARRTLVSKVD